jgi:hypothetical protein
MTPSLMFACSHIRLSSPTTRLLTRLLRITRRPVPGLGWVSLAFDAPLSFAFGFGQRRLISLRIHSPRLVVQPFTAVRMQRLWQL